MRANKRLLARSQIGASLIEAIASLAVASMVIYGMGTLSMDYMNNTEAASAAQQLKTMGEAARAYIADNSGLVSSRTTTTTPCTIYPADLVPYAPGITGVNTYGQNMVVLVLKNASGGLQALAVSYGGAYTPNDGQVALVANALGGDGGGVYSSSANMLVGSGSGWNLNLAALPGSAYRAAGVGCTSGAAAAAVPVNVGSNAIAYWVADMNASLQVLYRNQVPGNPALNTMNTPIIMGSMTIKVSGSACTVAELGSLARDSDGKVLTCTTATKWEPQGSAFWGDPVNTFAALPACTASIDGMTRIVKTPSSGTGTDPRAYTCRSASGQWRPLGTSDDGVLRVSDDIEVTALGIRMSDVKNRLPKYQHIGSYVVADGGWVPAPVCSTGGSPRVLAQSALQQNASAAAYNQVWAAASGAGWTIYSRSMDWTVTVAGMAIANTYCYFP